MFWNIQEFLDIYSLNRIAWFRGRQGGGKTSFSVRLGYELMERGLVSNMCSNIPNVFNTAASMLPYETGILDTYFVLDEGGVLLKYSKDAEGYIFGMRKTNTYIVVPSFLRPSTKICFLTVQYVFGLTRVGLPVKVFKWRLSDGDQRETGYFQWWFPQEIHGMYSSRFVPLGDAGIREAISRALDYIAKEGLSLYGDEYLDGGFSKHPRKEGGKSVRTYDLSRSGESQPNSIPDLEEIRGEFETQSENAIREIDAISLYIRKRD